MELAYQEICAVCPWHSRHRLYETDPGMSSEEEPHVCLAISMSCLPSPKTCISFPHSIKKHSWEVGRCIEYYQVSAHPPEGLWCDLTLGSRHLQSSIITLIPPRLFYPLGVSDAFSVSPPFLLNCFLFFFSSSSRFSLARPSYLLYPCLSLLPQFGSYH